MQTQHTTIRKTQARIDAKALIDKRLKIAPSESQVYDTGLRALLKYTSKLVDLTKDDDLMAVTEVLNGLNK